MIVSFLCINVPTEMSQSNLGFFVEAMVFFPGNLTSSHLIGRVAGDKGQVGTCSCTVIFRVKDRNRAATAAFIPEHRRRYSEKLYGAFLTFVK